MVVLGLILLLVVSVVVVSVLIAGDGPATLNLVGADIVTTERVLFLAGLVSALVAVLALWLLVRGTVRARARRSEMDRLRRAAASPRPVSPGPRSSPAGSPMPMPSPEPRRSSGRDDEGEHFATLPRE